MGPHQQLSPLGGGALRIALASLLLLWVVAAEAAPLTISFEGAAEALVFEMRAAGLEPEDLHVRARDDVIIIQIEGTQSRRGWLRTKDPLIKRSYTRDSQARRGATLLRVRLKRAAPGWMISEREISRAAGGVTLRFPRTRGALRGAARVEVAQDAGLSVSPPVMRLPPTEISSSPTRDGGLADASVEGASHDVGLAAPSRIPAPPRRTPPPTPEPLTISEDQWSLPAAILGGLGALALVLGVLFIRRRGGLPEGFKVRARARLPNKHELLVVECEGQHLLLSRVKGEVQLLTTLDEPMDRAALEARADDLLSELRTREEMEEPEDIRLLNALLHDPPKGDD